MTMRFDVVAPGPHGPTITVESAEERRRMLASAKAWAFINIGGFTVTRHVACGCDTLAVPGCEPITYAVVGCPCQTKTPKTHL